MTVKTYDPKKVHIIIGGFEMVGFVDGTFFTITMDDDAYSKVTGADGETSRAKNNNNGALATLSLQQTSSSNDVLSGFALADRLSNSGIVPVVVKDSLGTTILFSAEGWVKRTPDAPFAKEISNRDWPFDLANVDTFIGGNNL